MSHRGPTRRDVLGGGAAIVATGAMEPRLTGAGPVEPVYPDDAFSRPAAHHLPVFETLSGCQISGDPRKRARQYSATDLRLDPTTQPTATVWRFELRAEGQAVLVVSEKLRRVPEAISYRVANRSARPVTLSMQVHEMAWESGRETGAVAWVLGDGQRLGPGEEATLRYRFADAGRPSKPVSRGPRNLMSPVVIAAQGVEPGIAYELHLREFTVHYPPADGMTTTRLHCPSRIGAGESIGFDMAVSGGDGPLSLELRRDPWVVWRTHLTPDEARAVRTMRGAVVKRIVPWHVPPGVLTFGLAASGYRLAGPDARVTVTNRTRPRLPLAEKRLHGGRQTFFLNGKPVVWQGYGGYEYQPGNVGEFGASGTNVMCVPTCAGQHVYHITDPTWVAPGRFDFGDLDERVGFSLAANPAALIFLRVSMALPTFWAQEHPGEMALADMEQGHVPWLEAQSTPAAALASEAWRRDQVTALRALIRHCKAQPWAARVAGFWLGGGTTEEWFAWGSNDAHYTDYSAPAQAAFAAWHCRQPGDGGRHAGVEPTGVAVPTPAQRRCPGRDLYPSTPDGALAAAYNQHQSDLAVETIAHLARVVKEETAGRSFVCTFYGYVIQLAGEPRQALSGHFALRRLLAERDVDVIGGIPFFEGRDLTQGYSSHMSAFESIHAAGKLYCNESDLFSWLHHSLWFTEYDPKDPRGAAISMHRRVCADDAVHGAMAQKFTLLATWHHDAALQRDFALQSRALAESIALDRTPADEVALVVDDSTFAWTPPESPWLWYAHKQLLLRLGRTGAPGGVWLLSDLPRLPRRIRFVVIASGAAARTEELAAIRKLLAAGGRTVVAVGPVGLVDRTAGRWRADAVGELLGLPIRVDDNPLPGTVTVAATGESIAGPPTMRPRAHAVGEGLLRYPDGVTASAERDLAGGGHLIWCGVPPISTGLLRGWLRDAGVHLYAPPDYSVHAGRGIVSVTSPTAGTAPLAWPHVVCVRDLFDGWSAEGKEIACSFAAGQTRLFQVTRML